MSSISTGRTALRSAQRVVVKIGTNALTNATGRFNRQHFDALGQDLLWAAQGRELLVVSSGAIALGSSGWACPRALVTSQASRRARRWGRAG